MIPVDFCSNSDIIEYSSENYVTTQGKEILQQLDMSSTAFLGLLDFVRSGF